MRAKKWPSVLEILDRARQVEDWWQGDPHTFYRDRETEAVVKIHQATVPRLRLALKSNGWVVRDKDWRRTVYVRVSRLTEEPQK